MSLLIPWVEKYRPTRLDNIISHQNTISVLKNFIKNNKQIPHLLFYGPSGTGKTSVIMSLSEELYGASSNIMTLVINASEERGIDVVRNKITQFAKTKNLLMSDDKNMQNMYKLIVLDEVDSMTGDAQASLRQIIEKYTFNVRFCLICNYVKNINLALQSRCIAFQFSPLKKEDIKDKLKEIIKLEKLTMTNKAIDTLIYRCHGDMRRVINTLQSLHMLYKEAKINDDKVNICLGSPIMSHMEELVEKLINKYSFKEAYEYLLNLKQTNGYFLYDIITDVFNILLQKEIVNRENYIIKLAKLQYNLSNCINDDVQLVGFIGCFK